MFSGAHRWICDKAIELLYKESEYRFFNREEILKACVAPDYDEHTVGGHFAVYHKKDGSYTNWNKRRPTNAFKSLVNHFERAVNEKNEDELGRAMHYLMDMMTICHATGISDGRIRYMILIKPHNTYEKYTLKHIDEYYDEKDYQVDFINNDILDLMHMTIPTIMPLKYHLIFRSKKRYDYANKIMIPYMIYYVKGFLLRYIELIK